MALYENFHPRYMLARQVTLNLLYLLLVSAAQASFVNVSIDDTYGDAMTGQKPVYQPSGPWDGANCTHCDIVPSVALAFDGTWTAATYNPGPNSNINITLSFTGVSIWVFFILANLNTFGYGLATNCNFTLDGNFMSAFNSNPNLTTHDLDYNVTAFSIGGLSNTQHTLVISANDYPNSTFINFDYAIYTMYDSGDATSSNPGFSPSGVTGGIVGTSSTPSAEENDDSSTGGSRSGIVIGSVVGSLAFGIVGAVALLILFRRFAKKRGPPEPVITTFNQQPRQSYRDNLAMRSSHLPWQGSNYRGDPTIYGHIRSLSSMTDSTLVPVRREQFTHTNKSQDELCAVRQMEISQRLQSAEQEMHNLTSRQLIHNPDTSSEYDGTWQETEMGNMHEQILELRTQIERLQAERSSDWAQGLSDEAPPAYY